MQSRFGALALAALAAAALTSCGPPERTVARVGDRAVTVAEFEDLARNLPARSIDPSPEGKRRLLDGLLDGELLVAEAERLGFGKESELAQLRRRVRRDILSDLLYRRVIADRVSVSEAEIQAVWQAQDEELHLSRILSADLAGARAVLAKLTAGRRFAEVARLESHDRLTAPTGGDLGFVVAGMLSLEVERAARALRPGQWSAPIRVPDGYYIVRLEERRPREREDYELVRSEIDRRLRLRKMDELERRYVSGLDARKDLRLAPGGLVPLAEKWQNRPAEELLASGGDLARLGFTEADLATPLVTYRDGAYTIRDFFADFTDLSTFDRPPATDDRLLRQFVEERARVALYLREARERGLDRDPEAGRALRNQEKSFLVNRLYEQVIVPSARLTAEERAALRAAVGGAALTPEQQSQLAAQEARRFAAKRDAALQELLARLRQAHPPQVDEQVLADIAWPLPRKENP